MDSALWRIIENNKKTLIFSMDQSKSFWICKAGPQSWRVCVSFINSGDVHNGKIASIL
jgi:hypothetical protein